MQRSVVIIQCVRLPLHAAPISMCLAREHEWEGFKAGGYILTLGGGKKSKIWKQGRESTQFSNLETLSFKNSLNFLIWKHFILRIHSIF